MVSYSSILPPNSLGELLRPIADMSDAEFDALTSAITGPRSFSLKKDEIERLRDQLPASAAKNLTFLLTSLSFVYSHLARLTDAGMSYSEAIVATIDELENDAKWGEAKQKAIKRFEALFRPEIHKRLRKVQRLQTGFLPNAISFSSLVDLRPDFGDAEDLQFQGYLPVVLFRITTDASAGDKKTLVFQLNEDGLSNLRKALDRAESKLALLREHSPLANTKAKGVS